MTATLQQTPLHDWHAAHGGRLVDFAGWSMPVHYGSIVAEHNATRQNGKVKIEKADAKKSAEAEFMMLREGLVVFEGNAHELRASRDPYIQDFLS